MRLFFTVLNPADSQQTSGGLLWLGQGKGAMDTYNLASGDSIALNLVLAEPFPGGGLYIDGGISVTTKAGATFNHQVGQASGSFIPGTPLSTTLKGNAAGSVSSVQFDVGFELNVPWDGTSADCHGKWWAKWH